MPGLSNCVGRISLLLDYYPSAQFAGIHLAKRLGLYSKRGLDLTLIPPPGAGGDEPQLVCNLQQAYDKDGSAAAGVPRLAVGTVEQNVLIPAVARGMRCKAFATVFQSSPLALAALPGAALSTPGDLADRTVGMHIDSMELMSSLLAAGKTGARVVEVSRAHKVQDLLAGKVDAIQIYDCMEALELRALLGTMPTVLRLSDIGRTLPHHSAVSLGYSQVLFGARWTLRSAPARAALGALLDASAEGWRIAQEDPAAAAEAIVADRRELGVVTNTLVDSVAFQKEALERCLPYVLPQQPGGGDLNDLTHQIGAIDPVVWQEAADAMCAIGTSPALVSATQSLDTVLWPPAQGSDVSSKHRLVTDGLQVSESMRVNARLRAHAFEKRAGRKPALAIVTVGAEDPHEEVGDVEEDG